MRDKCIQKQHDGISAASPLAQAQTFLILHSDGRMRKKGTNMCGAITILIQGGYTFIKLTSSSS
jgi:hypothetical protein